MSLDALFIFILFTCVISCFIISIFIFNLVYPGIKRIIINKTKEYVSAWENNIGD